jgi:hypothetical protein
MNLHIYSLSGVCPLQGMGFIGEKSLYFHANRGRWRMTIADTLGEAIINMGRVKGLYWEGLDPTGEDISLTDAKRIIQKCAAEYERFQNINRVQVKSPKVWQILCKALGKAEPDQSFNNVIAQVCKKLQRAKAPTKQL